MSREWAPGDVAMANISSRGGKRAVVVRSGTFELGRGYGWVVCDECGGGVQDSLVSNIRPLLLLDPDDREQAEAICKAFVVSGGWQVIPADVENTHDYRLGQVQAALRSLLAPPKPAEPTGLGAVVEDAQGQRFVRVDRIKDFEWLPTPRPRIPGERPAVAWSDVPAVRVLSPGVTP